MATSDQTTLCISTSTTLCCHWASVVARVVKNPPAMWETWVQPLDCEDLLEKGMATHSNILAWELPWTDDLVGYTPWSHIELDTPE